MFFKDHLVKPILSINQLETNSPLQDFNNNVNYRSRGNPGLPNIVLQYYCSLEIKIARAYWAKIIIAAFCFAKKNNCNNFLLLLDKITYDVNIPKSFIYVQKQGFFKVHWKHRHSMVKEDHSCPTKKSLYHVRCRIPPFHGLIFIVHFLCIFCHEQGPVKKA